MRRKRLLPADRPGAHHPIARRDEAADEPEGWIRWLAPIVFGLGIGFIVVLSWGVVILAIGGVGDCFDAACEQDRQFWARLGTGQALTWVVVVFGLALLAHRWNHNLWLLVELVSATGRSPG